MKTISNFKNEDDVAYGVAQLISAHPIFNQIYQKSGPPCPRVTKGGFAALARMIVEQQVSLASAAAIWVRVKKGVVPFTAKRMLELTDAEIGKIGLSRPKQKYMRALAQTVEEGELLFRKLPYMNDADVLASLIQVKGIGRWTAEVYLLAVLGRPDVMPSGDLALQVAAQDLLKLDARPTEKQMDEISSIWSPWRAVAARLLWEHYRILTGKG
jgi:DNA-3-methyladenine glycosylase II